MLDPVLLSRIQFAFVISFHIIFPAFGIGLAAWLATIEGMRLAAGNPLYRRVFDFWLKVFGLSFGMGVVSGIVMASQFGTNWSVLAERAGPIQGPLLGCEAFTAFMLEATFLGVVLLGRERAPPWFYFFSCCMVSIGTMLSSFWIMANNSWMQVPVGGTIVGGRIVPTDWRAIVAGPVMRVRWQLVLGYALLGAGWLTLKSEGALRDWAWRRIPFLAVAVLVVLMLAAAAAFAERTRATGVEFLRRAWGLVFPLIAVLAILGVLEGARRRRDGWPFALTTVFFLASFASLAVMFWP